MKQHQATEAVPEGIAFLRGVQQVANACAEHTDQHLPEMGKAAPETLESLGKVLSILYRMGTCFWGCRGGDHLVEYIVGRSCSTALAAISLMRFGYYDEALSLARSVGEAANLLTLFSKDRSSLENWRASDDRTRKAEFSPVKVRLALEKLGHSDLGLIKEDRYRQLSTIGIHLSPLSKPQNYNPGGVPTLGAVFQEVGVVVTLNEIATAVGFLAPSAAILLDITPERWTHLKEAVIELLSSVGGIHATDLDGVMRALRGNL